MTAKFFTPAEDAYLTAEYATKTPIKEIAKHLGRSEGAIYSRAIKLKLKRQSTAGTYRQDGLTVRAILEAASRPNGVSAAEMNEAGRTFINTVGMLMKRGQVFSAKRYGMSRYFTDKEAAQACEKRLRAEHPPKAWKRGVYGSSQGFDGKSVWGVRVHAPKFDHDAPLIFTPETKYTICPSPPERVLYSNTYPRY
jgi:hypothetical protein